MAPKLDDTIAAIATAPGGGIGIVRLSGKLAEPIVASLVKPWPQSRPPSHKLLLGWAHDPKSGERIDQVLACVMRAPNSFTGEDVAELQAHGGARLLAQLLDAALSRGARLAEPGEFTRRAFEHGRIDLTRAEAVAQLIAARSDRALAAAQSLAGGALAQEITAIRGQVVRALAELEGALDFPDEALESAAEHETGRALAALGDRCTLLASGYRRIDHDRLEVALVGRANAGKSSLFNALLGRARAIVDESPGTTRDLLEAEIEILGISVLLLDTAGERWPLVDDGQAHIADRVEGQGVAIARSRRAAADLVLLILDGATGFGAEERALVASLQPQPFLIVWNKHDLCPAPPELATEVIETSATTHHGLDALRAAIARALGDDSTDRAPPIGARQSEALRDAAVALAQAATLLIAGEPAELAALQARDALHHLGRVTGETVDGEVLDAIFSRFCIGK